MSSSALRARQNIEGKFDETRMLFEKELQHLSEGGKPNFKGAIAGTAKSVSTVVE